MISFTTMAVTMQEIARDVGGFVCHRLQGIAQQGGDQCRHPEACLAPSQSAELPDQLGCPQPGDAVPDGVFCYNDPVAVGAVRAISEAGYKVPDDIAVVGGKTSTTRTFWRCHSPRSIRGRQKSANVLPTFYSSALARSAQCGRAKFLSSPNW
jgi:Periplasmic binding protein-like domain